MKTQNIIKTFSAIVLLAFACITLFMSSSVIFDWFEIRVKQGNYVLFIVWTNFVSGLLYVAAAYYLFKNKRNALSALIVTLVILIIAFIALQFYISNDGIYEIGTVKAMIFRMTFTLVFTVIVFFYFKKLDRKN